MLLRKGAWIKRFVPFFNRKGERLAGVLAFPCQEASELCQHCPELSADLEARALAEREEESMERTLPAAPAAAPKRRRGP